MDLSEKINLLYNFFYSKSIKNNYKINNLDLGKINLDDIKFKYIDSDNYNDMLTETFLGKFTLIKFDNDNLSTILKKFSEDLSVFLTITPYKNKKNIESLEDSNNLESLFSYILSELVINKKTKHILLPILNIDAEFQQISDVLKNYDSFNDYSTAIQDNKISNIFSVSIKENFFKGMFLDKYLENHECKLKHLLFQVIHTLAIIQDKFKGFRHNKLNHNNIYAYVKKDVNNSNTYEFNNKKYYLSGSDLDIKITNFHNSSIPNYYSSKNNIPFNNKKNDYFDLHFFLNNLYHKGYLETNCKETNKFINRILPEKYRNKTNNYYLEKDVELFRPKDLLEDDYFKDYLNKPQDEKNYMSENNYFNGSKVLTRKLKDNKYKYDKLNRYLIESDNSDVEINQSGGGTLQNLPYKFERNDPFMSNDKRKVFKSKKESESENDIDSDNEIELPIDFNSRKNRKKFFNKPGFSKFPKNSPFNPKGFNKERQNSDKRKPIFNQEKKEPYYKEEKRAERTDSETNSDSDKSKKSFNYGPFSSNENKKIRQIRENEKPPPQKPKSPEIVAEQIVYKNPAFKPDRKFKEKEWWDPDKNEAEEFRSKPIKVPQGKIHSPGSNKYESDSQNYSTDSGSESNTDYTEERPKYNNSQKHHYQKSNYNSDSNSYQKKPHYQKSNYNSDSHSQKPHYQKSNYHSDSNSYQKKPNYHKDVTQTPLLAEQRVYEPAPKKGSDHRHPKYNHPGFIKLEDDSQFPPDFVWDYKTMPWPRSMPLKKPNEIPLQKIYNINLGNASNKHTNLNTLYEDIIPGDPYTYSMVKISERQHLLKFIKNIVLQNNNDENMTLQSDQNMKSLQSFFRILAFNPYSNNNRNPYENIPVNFLLYNMAYPVRYDGSSVNIAKNSMGLNLRIYSLSNGAYNKHKSYTTTSGNEITWRDYDVWREIHYYEYVRDVILQRNVSPNFITMFFYSHDIISKINYNEINNIIRGHKGRNYINLQLNNQGLQLKDIDKDELNKYFTPTTPLNDQQVATFGSNLTNYSNISLLTITEAPTSSFYGWAQPSYDRFGAQFKMVSTGHHADEVWSSILFQLMYSLLVMEKHNINMRNFSISNNVFIKDLFMNTNSINYWLYKIGEYNFYVPNYGYLLLIDSRYVDVNTTNNLIDYTEFENQQQKFKINNLRGLVSGDLTGILDMKDVIRDVLNELLSTPLFDSMSTNIQNKVTNIQFELATKNLIEIIGKHFGELLNNRIGTPILKSEKDNLPIGVSSDITQGKMVVYQKRYDEYYWGVIVGDEEGGKVNVMTRDDSNNPVVSNQFVSNLITYPKHLRVEQDKNNNVKLTPDGLLETYTLE